MNYGKVSSFSTKQWVVPTQNVPPDQPKASVPLLFTGLLQDQSFTKNKLLLIYVLMKMFRCCM